MSSAWRDFDRPTPRPANTDDGGPRRDAGGALRVPPDLDAALRAAGDAKARFDAFPLSTRRAILAWIAVARWPETRAKRIEQAVRDAVRGLRGRT